MSEQAVSAPGLPGVTVIESSVNAPAKPISVTPTNTTNMSPSQARAMKWVDTVAKPAILNRGGADNAFLLAKQRDALAHVFHNGPEPAFLKADELVTQARAVDPDSVPAMTRHFAPMRKTDVEQIAASGKAQGLTPGTAGLLAKFCLDAGIPTTQADGIAKRVARHFADGGRQPLSASEQADYYQEAVRLFGSKEKFAETQAKARAYLASVGPEAMRFLDPRFSLSFDPPILIALAALATARGVKVK
jgi:hypothetical protein